MRRYIQALCVSMMLWVIVAPAFGGELWDYHLRGLDEGLAAGLVAPPGFYFINTFVWAPSFHSYGVTDRAGIYHAGEANPNTKITAFVDVPVLLWTPGCKIFGADYGAAVAETFDNTTFSLRTGPNDITGPSSYSSAQWGAANTTLVPLILGWHLSPQLHFTTGLAIGLNDGTTSPGDSVASTTKYAGLTIPGGSKSFTYLSKHDGDLYLWSSNDCYTFAPRLGITWLYAGWNISADFIYSIYTKDTDTNYQSGNQLFGDYTCTYTFGRWSLGVGAESTMQLQNDKFALLNPMTGRSTGYKSQPNTKYENYAVGPLLGYNFGPCSLMFIYNFAVSTKNDVGGDFFALRLVVPLGNPCLFGG
jgi:hypothetical protein